MADLISTLEQLRDHQRDMVVYYSKSDEKRRQNEALVAAGLPPMWGDSTLAWDRDNAAKHGGYVAALDRVIAQLSGQPMAPEDWASHAQNAFDAALPDDASPYDVGKAWQKVGEHLAAAFAEHLEEHAGAAQAEAA